MSALSRLVKLRQATRAFGSVLFKAGLVKYTGIAATRGDAYLSTYGYNPHQLRQQLLWMETGESIRWYARRAAKSNEYIKRFLKRSQQTAFFDKQVEMPGFRGVDADVAKMVGEAWADWWRNGTDNRGRILWEAERLHFRDWLVDGEIFFDWPGDKLRAIPSDMIKRAIMMPGDMTVDSWLTSASDEISAEAIIHAAIIESNWQTRGISYLAQALPEIFWNMFYRDNTGQGIAAMSKIAAITTNEGVGNAAGLPPMGAGGYDPMGGDGDGSKGVEDRFRGAFVADMKQGENVEVPAYGPPTQAVERANQSPALIGIALGVSESELTGDHFKHNFASLQVAEIRDVRTYTDNRQWWYAEFRRPVFKHWLDMKIANNEFPAAVIQNYTKLKPRWQGPRLVSAQPLKDAQALRAEAELGLVNLRQLAASQGENAETNAAENAEILNAVKAAEKADDGGVGEKLDMLLENAK